MPLGLQQFIRQWVLPFVDPRSIASVALLPQFIFELKRFRRSAQGQSVLWRDTYPCLLDRQAKTPFDPHYFFQAAWLARRLATTRPSLHLDVGSSVAMLSVLSAGVPIVFLDYRPLDVQLTGLYCVRGAAVQLPFPDGIVASVSSLHVIEHIGLGRYGDPLDPSGSQQVVAELVRVLQPGGRLFLSLPVGRERVCFNAHRVFAPQTIMAFAQGAHLDTFSLIDDAGCFRENVTFDSANGCEYGCGLFEFVKSRA